MSVLNTNTHRHAAYTIKTHKSQAATASCCWSTFHKAVPLFYSSSLLCVGHNETNPEWHLLLRTGRHHKNPPPHVSLPGPEVSGSQLSTQRDKSKINNPRDYSLQAVTYAQKQVLPETASLIFSLLVSQFSAPHTPTLVLPKPTAAIQGKSWGGKEAFLTVTSSYAGGFLFKCHTCLPCGFHKIFCFCPFLGLAQSCKFQNQFSIILYTWIQVIKYHFVGMLDLY